jgi:hypothetical protein
MLLWYLANANALAPSSFGNFIRKPFFTFKENQPETKPQRSLLSLPGS